MICRENYGEKNGVFINKKEREYIQPKIKRWTRNGLDFYTENVEYRIRKNPIIITDTLVFALKENNESFRLNILEENLNYNTVVECEDYI